MVRIPQPKTLLAAGVLTGSYVDKTPAVDIRGWGNLTLHVRSHSGAGSVVVKVFIDPTATTAPAASTALYQYADPSDGSEIELTTLTAERACFPLHGLSGNWLLTAAKYSATAATATLILTGTVDMG